MGDLGGGVIVEELEVVEIADEDRALQDVKEYCNGKVDYIIKKVDENGIACVWVIGLPDQYFQVFCEKNKLVGKDLGDQIPRPTKDETRFFNSKRDRLHKFQIEPDKMLLVVQTPCGEGYTTMIADSLSYFGCEPSFVGYSKALLQVDKFLDWTGLNKLDPSTFKNAFVALGDYVSLTSAANIAGGVDFCTKGPENESGDWKWTRFVNEEESKVLIVLGWAQSYWGDIARALVSALCKLGASEILHAAVKVGTIVENVVGQKKNFPTIWSPREFVIVNSDGARPSLLIKKCLPDLKWGQWFQDEEVDKVVKTLNVLLLLDSFDEVSEVAKERLIDLQKCKSLWCKNVILFTRNGHIFSFGKRFALLGTNDLG